MEIFDSIWTLLQIGFVVGLIIVAIIAFIRVGWELGKYLVPILLILYIISNWV